MDAPPSVLRCIAQERAVLSKTLPHQEPARVTRGWVAFDSRTIAPHG